MSADLNAIKARWAAATPGPWFFNGYSGIGCADNGYDAWLDERIDEGHTLYRRINAEPCEPCGTPDCGYYDEDYDREPFVAHVSAHHGDTAVRRRALDAEAIAHAPEDIAALLAEVERLRSPERDTTGLTYGDKAAWRDLLARAEKARADLRVAVARIDEIEKWAADHFGDSTEFPTDLAFAFWGMPSAADLGTSEDECIDDTDLCEHGLRFGCEACAKESP